MTNRPLTYIIRDQRPLVLPATATVRQACRAMWERRAGSCLVVDDDSRLAGIFTGRDAVRLLAKATNARSRPSSDAVLAAAMTREPETIEPTDHAIDALKIMGAGGFRHVPVVDGETICGVVSRGDLKGMEFEELRWRAVSAEIPAANRPLTEIIGRRKPLVLEAGQTVGDACRVMVRRKIGSVLVADKRGRLKGIFTGRDAVRALAKSATAATLPLSRAMTADPATLPSSCTAIDGLRAMNDHGFRHIPVVDDGRIRGLVARSDFTGLEIDRLDEEEHLREVIW